MKAFERSGDRVGLEVYANGNTRSTVAVFELADGSRCIATDSLNLNRAADRQRWVNSLPEPLRAEADELAVAIGIEVERWRATAGPAKGRDSAIPPFAAADPWPEPVAGDELLDSLAAIMSGHVVLTPHGLTVVALWVLHTYVVDVGDYTPYLHLRSPVRGCGKTTVLQLLEQLTFRPCKTDGITAAALYRRIDRHSPTMLLDEVDTRVNGHQESGELLRGVLNSGFQRGGKVTICVGDEHEERDYRTYSPKCLSGIGRLWDTVASRAIPVHMDRASRAQLATLKKIRGDRIAAICDPYRRKLTRWAADVRPELAEADPDVPDALDGRQADVWRPLLAIADSAGAAWPTRARNAALALAGVSEDEGDLALLLLGDLRELFGSTAADDDKLPSARIVEQLTKRDDRPWSEYRHDKPISATQAARLLARFGIKSRSVRLASGEVVRGYRYGDCLTAFQRYVPGATAGSATAATGNAATPGVADVALRSDGMGGDLFALDSASARYEQDERENMGL